MLRGAIVDLDGTVYRGDSLLPGAEEGIRALRAAGLDVLFFSNNPTRDGAAYVERLRSLGVEARDGEACSAGVVTAEYLADEHPDDAVYLLGSDGVAEILRDHGLALVDEPAAADVLLASWDPEFDYDDMRAALRVPVGATFLGTDPDRTFPSEDGPVPGSGAIIRAVAGVIEREPERVLGKPSAVAAEAALSRLDLPAEECLIVGDRLSTDVALGERAGMTTALVRTGADAESDLDDHPVSPDHVLDSLADAGRLLED
jgi:HAD superfamily hydrolase (TIGR01450 family)